MGAGKTKHFIQPFFEADCVAGRKPFVATPTCSLTRKESGSLKAAHYLHDKKKIQANDVSSMAITVNSLINDCYDPFLEGSSVSYWDEFVQVLRSATHGTVKDTDRRELEEKIAALLRQSTYL